MAATACPELKAFLNTLLSLAGGATILLDVDCIEAQLCDLGPRWPVSFCPTHKLDEDGGAGS